MTSIPSTIYVDARALQDSNYRYRGVGQHSSALLQALRDHAWTGARPELVAVLDVKMEPLHLVQRLLFDRVMNTPRPRAGESADRWFLSLSPMTHDPVWAAEFLFDKSLFKAALFYDLIPLEIPERYLAAPSLRSEYMVALAWLRRYDRFAAISRFSADGLIRRMSIASDKVFVSGVAVRSGLEPQAAAPSRTFEERDCIVVSGGGDPRKNPECALVAHAGSKALSDAGIRLHVFGGYPAAMREQFRALYASNGGSSRNLVFHEHLTDDELHRLYGRGRATVVASRAEGFSIPIIESNAAGTPVVVSDVGAHPELVEDAAWRFHPDDSKRLRQQLEALVLDKARWQSAIDSQAGIWKRFTEAAVGERLVGGLLQSSSRRRQVPMISRKARPDIAVLSPLPPAMSGVADYTAASLRPLKEVANLHMFTSTPSARWENGWASLGSVAAASLSSRRFDATVCVMGNSFHHREVHDYLMTHGGACIAHDARQIDYYFHEKGARAALALAGREMKREVHESELTGWLLNQRELPTLFLSELVAASSPLIVHSATTALEIERLYGARPVLLPFAQYSEPLLDRVAAEDRRSARRRLGLEEDRIVLVTFGIVSDDKAPHEILWALKLLRTWGVDAELIFCGMAQPAMLALVDDITTRLGLKNHVRTFRDPIGAETYRDYLVAADVGIQLRTYFMGGLSGALNDCISAALPAVANAHLATAMQAPAFVRRVPDGLSSLLIGEAVLEILASGDNVHRPLEAARTFGVERTPSAYCRLLLEALELEVELPAAALV